MNIKNWFKENIYNVIIILILLFFGILYWKTVIYLPLFGDSTIHGQHVVVLIEKGWKYLDADYPPFYYYIVSFLYQFFGEKANNLVVYIGILLTLIYTYFISFNITKNKIIGILMMFIVGFSSKLIFYSARLYQEIFITSLFLMSLYYLYIILNKHNQKKFYLLVFLVGVNLSIKQQGLFILYSSIVFLYFILLLFKKTNFKNLLIITLIPIIIGISFYGILFNTKGKIIPGAQEFKAITLVNKYGQLLFKYNKVDEELVWNDEKEIIYNKINQDAIKRKTNFQDIFLNFNKSYTQLGLYLNNFWNLKNLDIFAYSFFFISLIGIIFYFRYNKFFMLYLIIFFIVNVILFIKNNDQLRYHLPLSFIFLIFGFSMFSKKFKSKNNLVYYPFLVLFLVMNTPLFSYNIEKFHTGFEKLQIYSPSIGGIKSIIETGLYIKNNLKENETFFMNGGNEMVYYSNRGAVGDSEIMITGKYKEYINNLDNNVKFIVILYSQIVDDYTNGTKVTKDFYNYVSSNYPLIYTSSKSDIFIFKLH